MRFKLPIGKTLLFFSIFILALIALIPMRLGLDWLQIDRDGLAARQAQGSIWNGTLIEAQFAKADLGSLDADLGFFPLLIGEARLHLGRDAQDASGLVDGTLIVAGADFGLEDFQGTLNSSGLMRPLPITNLTFDTVSVSFEDGLCQEAQGTVRATLAGAVNGLRLPGEMTGVVRCDAGRLLVPLVGPTGVERFDIRLAAGGTYEAALAIRPLDERSREELQRSGFRPGPNGYEYRLAGSL